MHQRGVVGVAVSGRGEPAVQFGDGSGDGQWHTGRARVVAGGLQVFDHVADASGGGEVGVGELDEELLEQRRVGPASAERGEHLPGRQAGCPYQGGRFGERSESDADQHLVHGLHQLTGADGAEVRQPGGQGAENGQGAFDVLLLAAEHERQLTAFGARCAARQRGVDPAGAQFGGAFGELVGASWVDARHVDDEHAVRGRAQHSVRSEDHLLHDVGGIEGEDHHSRRGEQSGRLGRGGPVPRESGRGLRPDVVDAHRALAPEEPAGDRGAHDSEPCDAYLHLS